MLQKVSNLSFAHLLFGKGRPNVKLLVVQSIFVRGELEEKLGKGGEGL
jgi:hypothetical protein